MMRRYCLLGLAVASIVGWMAASGRAAEQVEPDNTPRWYASGSLGVMKFEGDQNVKDGIVGVFRLGYDHTEWWSYEGVLTLAPYLKENKRYDYPTDSWISRLEESAGEGVHSTWGAGLAADALLHFAPWEKIDPFLSLGAGMTYYGDPLRHGQFDPTLRGGGGVMFHFNDAWAARVDGRVYFAGVAEVECNGVVDAGVIWRWGTDVAPAFKAIGGDLDSDGDGLTDKEETETYHTDPYKPDTDGDGLRDGEEVLKYKTDPNNKDTDFDGLTDGEEVLKHSTNPLDRDTDRGGVADGHEVIEDSTNPLDGSDDLMLIELLINFEWDKTIINAPYIPKLDIVGKVLLRNPTATARIEGHADRNRDSKADYNKNLSLRRANSVMSYLVQQVGIDGQRLTAHGYGFDRPKGPNDPKNGNPANRRVEVYIRGVDKAKEKLLMETAEEVPAPAVTPSKAPETK